MLRKSRFYRLVNHNLCLCVCMCLYIRMNQFNTFQCQPVLKFSLNRFNRILRNHSVQIWPYKPIHWDESFQCCMQDRTVHDDRMNQTFSNWTFLCYVSEREPFRMNQINTKNQTFQCCICEREQFRMSRFTDMNLTTNLRAIPEDEYICYILKKD